MSFSFISRHKEVEGFADESVCWFPGGNRPRFKVVNEKAPQVHWLRKCDSLHRGRQECSEAFVCLPHIQAARALPGLCDTGV